MATAAPPLPSPARSATTTAAAPARRAAGPARKAPGITINYAYLRHDLLTLAVLAPAMVVILLVAYFAFHF